MAAGVKPKKMKKSIYLKLTMRRGKEKKETSPVYNMSVSWTALERSGAGWVSKTKAGETYLSCNINEPFQKDGMISFPVRVELAIATFLSS